MASYVTFSHVPCGNVRQQLVVCTAFKIPKIGLQLPIFDIMPPGVSGKRQYAMVQRVQTLMKLLVVLSFMHLHVRAKGLHSIPIDLILTLKFGTLYFYCFNMLTDYYLAPILLNGSLRTTDQSTLSMTESYAHYLLQNDHSLNFLDMVPLPGTLWHALRSAATISPNFYRYAFAFISFKIRLNTLLSIGTPRTATLCDRCMDISKSSGLCGMDHTP